MILAAVHPASLDSPSSPGGEKEVGCFKESSKSVGEFRDQDETRDPPLPICNDVFCGVTTLKKWGARTKSWKGQSHAHLRSCDVEDGGFQDGRVLVYLTQEH